MTLPALLEVTPDDISNLQDDALRELVARLCRAELSEARLPVSSVTAGGGQNDPDGGIDVRVALPPGSLPPDFIPRVNTGFQVKATPMLPSGIPREMRRRNQLRPAIKDLIASGGAYVIIGSRDSTADRPLKLRRDAMRKALGRNVAHPDAITDFIGSDRLADWTNRYPGVAMWVREQLGKPLIGWTGYGNWAQDTATGELAVDDSLRVEAQGMPGLRQLTINKAIADIRATLTQAGTAVRLVGLSGVGKTRLAQALFDTSIGQNYLLHHAAIYGDLGRGPNPSAQEMLDRLMAQGSSAILIIDNCNPETHRSLLSCLRASKSKVSLLTIEYDVTADEPEETEVFRLHGTNAILLDTIIHRHFPRLNIGSREKIGLLSDGNARVALALAGAASRTGNLGTLKDAEIFSRLFWQRGTKDTQLERVAHAISLVYSFDSTRVPEAATSNTGNELAQLSRLASIDSASLLHEIARLQRRGLLQRRGKWRALLPHALANRLAHEALESVDDAMLNELLWSNARLLRSFARRLSGLHESLRAREIVTKWLTDDDWLAQPHNFNALGIDLFTLVSPVCPEVALEVLSRVTSIPGEGLLAKDGQSLYMRIHFKSFIEVSRHLAYDPTLFSGAAEVLARISQNEDDNAQNKSQSATSVLTMLFRPAMSGTHASVEARLTFLNRLFTSQQAKQQQLALECLGTMLQTHWHGINRLDSFGARARDGGWRPSSDEDLLHWYQSVIAFVTTISSQQQDSGPELVKKVARYIDELWFEVKICDGIEKFAKIIQGDQRGTILWKGIATVLVGKRQTKVDDVVNRLETLEKFLRPKTLNQKLNAFVFGSMHDALDPLAEEQLHSEGDNADAAPFHLMFRQLARDLLEQINDHSILEPLMATYHFGHLFDLGRIAGFECEAPLKSWAELVSTFRNLDIKTRDTRLLCGFLHGVKAKTPLAVSKLINLVENDALLVDLQAEIYGTTGVGEQEIDKLVEIAKSGTLPADRFRRFVYGGILNDVPPQKHADLTLAITHLLQGLDVAIEIMAMRLHSLRSRNVEIDEYAKAACCELMLKIDFSDEKQQDSYRIENLANIALVGPQGILIANALCKALVEAFIKNWSIGWKWEDLVALILRTHPKAALDAFWNYDNEDDGYRYRSLLDRLSGRERHLQEVPDEVLLAWGAHDSANRDPWLAGQIDVVTAAVDGSLELSLIAKALLARAYDKESILDELGRHVLPSSWHGSYLVAAAPRVKMLDQICKSNDPQLRNWAQIHLERIADRINHENTRERHREESFE